MEEKERYIIDRFDEDIFDTKKEYYPSNQTICEIINKQDKRIKELKEENQQLIKALNGEVFINYKLPMENAKLRQQLAESERKLEEYKKCNCKECMTDYEKNLNQIIDKYLNENIKLKQQLHDLPKKIVEDFYDEIRHRAILEDDYCPDHKLERKYGVRKCLLENIRTTILKKYGDKNEN